MKEITVDETGAWLDLKLRHGGISAFLKHLQRTRVSTSFDLIRHAFDPDRPDTVVQKWVRQEAVKFSDVFVLEHQPNQIA